MPDLVSGFLDYSLHPLGTTFSRAMRFALLSGMRRDGKVIIDQSNGLFVNATLPLQSEKPSLFLLHTQLQRLAGVMITD